MSQMTLICYSSYNQSKQTFQKYFWIWNPETAHNIWPSVFSSTFFSHGWMACNGKSKVLFFGAHYRQCCLCSKSSWKRAKNNNIRLPVTVRAWLKKVSVSWLYFFWTGNAEKIYNSGNSKQLFPSIVNAKKTTTRRTYKLVGFATGTHFYSYCFSIFSPNCFLCQG